MIPAAALGAMTTSGLSGGGFLSGLGAVAKPLSGILGGGGMFGGGGGKVDNSKASVGVGDFIWGGSSKEEQLTNVVKVGLIAVAGVVALKIYKGK